MSRAHLDYTARGQGPSAPATGFDVDTPIAGTYQMRLVSGGVPVAVRIWFGAPLDPVDGSELDRAPRWNATANGDVIPLERVWPKCAADPIDEAEAAYLATRKTWAERNAPDSPLADPTRRVDFLTAPLPW